MVTNPSPSPDLPTPVMPDPPDPGELPVEPDEGPALPAPPIQLYASLALFHCIHPQFMRAATFRWPATTVH
ncbi:MAG: hypothetical protein JWQ03_2103 [Variovorax sp.]|nr:hypothetical protein [Variovorax sp.]